MVGFTNIKRINSIRPTLHVLWFYVSQNWRREAMYMHNEKDDAMNCVYFALYRLQSLYLWLVPIMEDEYLRHIFFVWLGPRRLKISVFPFPCTKYYPVLPSSILALCAITSSNLTIMRAYLCWELFNSSSDRDSSSVKTDRQETWNKIRNFPLEYRHVTLWTLVRIVLQLLFFVGYFAIRHQPQMQFNVEWYGRT
jgi:hypothetical protein